jgi:hypothetical protein
MPPKPVSSARVTDTALRAAKPAEKPYRIAAGSGLYLEITPNGSKPFAMASGVNGLKTATKSGAEAAEEATTAAEAAITLEALGAATEAARLTGMLAP